MAAIASRSIHDTAPEHSKHAERGASARHRCPWGRQDTWYGMRESMHTTTRHGTAIARASEGTSELRNELLRANIEVPSQVRAC